MTVLNFLASSPIVEILGIFLTVAMIIRLVVEEGRLRNHNYCPQNSSLFAFFRNFVFSNFASGNFAWRNLFSRQIARPIEISRVKSSLRHQHVRY